MGTSNKVLKTNFFWLLSYFLPFGLGVLCSFYIHLPWVSVVFLFLALHYLLGYIGFQVNLQEDGLAVAQKINVFLPENRFIPYTKIKEVYVRSTFLGKLFNLNNLIIEFEDAAAEQKITKSLFGFKYKYQRFDYPLVWGNMVNIPVIKNKDVTEFIDLVNSKTSNQFKVEYLFITYPYNRHFYFSVIIFSNLLLAMLVIYFVIRIFSY